MNVLQEFQTRVVKYTGDASIKFDAEWLMVVTWKDATPYYGRRNEDEVRNVENNHDTIIYITCVIVL